MNLFGLLPVGRITVGAQFRQARLLHFFGGHRQLVKLHLCLGQRQRADPRDPSGKAGGLELRQRPGFEPPLDKCASARLGDLVGADRRLVDLLRRINRELERLSGTLRVGVRFAGIARTRQIAGIAQMRGKLVNPRRKPTNRREPVIALPERRQCLPIARPLSAQHQLKLRGNPFLKLRFDAIEHIYPFPQHHGDLLCFGQLRLVVTAFLFRENRPHRRLGRLDGPQVSLLLGPNWYDLGAAEPQVRLSHQQVLELGIDWTHGKLMPPRRE